MTAWHRAASRRARLALLPILALGAGLVPGAASAAQKAFVCTPTGAAEFPGNRIHIRCGQGDGAISFFAMGVAKSDDANRVLSLASTAVVAKRKIQVFYDPADLSGAGIGCLTSDCRLILGVELF